MLSNHLLNIYVPIGGFVLLLTLVIEDSYCREQWLMQRLIIVQNVETSHFKYSATDGTAISTLPPADSRDVCEEGAQRMQRVEAEEECREGLASTHDMAVTHSNSQRLWLAI